MNIICPLHGRNYCNACFVEPMDEKENKNACESIIQGHYKRTGGQKMIVSHGVYEKLRELGINTEYVEVDQPIPPII